MLQQIIDDMYIEPELLAELSEDQKQMIFLKIREEQVRRYNEWECKDVNAEANQKVKSKKLNGVEKRVQWVLGQDQNPWTWVMGEHKSDKTIDAIIEDEHKAAARSKAEKEAEELREQEEAELKKKMEQEKKRLEEERKAKEAELEALRKQAAAQQAEREAKAKSDAARAKADAARAKADADKAAAEKAEAERLYRMKKEREEQLKREAEEAKRTLNKLKETQERAKLTREESYRQLRVQRESEIMSAFHKTRALFESKSNAESQQMEKAWKQSEVKAKQADVKRRSDARSAREDYKRNVMRSSASQQRQTFRESAILITNSEGEIEVNSAMKMTRQQSFHKVRPKSRIDACTWFLDNQKSKGSGRSRSGGIEAWFHGVISRDEAEVLLEKKPVHSFLVRVSEKIFGYAISYKSEERIKHYLVDINNDKYQFFGTNQLEHDSIGDLVNYHKDNPVSSAGQERLIFPCGQCNTPPDYADLFPELVETTSM